MLYMDLSHEAHTALGSEQSSTVGHGCENTLPGDSAGCSVWSCSALSIEAILQIMFSVRVSRQEPLSEDPSFLRRNMDKNTEAKM